MDAKTTWATTLLAAGIGFVGAMGGAMVGAITAMKSADQQVETQRQDRLTAERNEANLRLLETVDRLGMAWVSYRYSYPEAAPTQDQWVTYVLPQVLDLRETQGEFSLAVSHSLAYGSQASVDIAGHLSQCTDGLYTHDAGPYGGIRPPTDAQWEVYGQCFNDASEALQTVIRTEITTLREGKANPA